MDVTCTCMVLRILWGNVCIPESELSDVGSINDVHYVVQYVLPAPVAWDDPGMDEMVKLDSYDTIQESLRPYLAEKLKRMFDALEPYVDGSFGEVAPAHAAAAVAVLRELGRLYRVAEVPRQAQVGMTREEHDALVADAVRVARLEWESARIIAEADTRRAILEQVRGPQG